MPLLSYLSLLYTVLAINLVSISHIQTYHIGTHHYSLRSMKRNLYANLVTLSYIYISLGWFLELLNHRILCYCSIQRWRYTSLFENLQSIPLISLDLRALLLLRAAPPPGGLPPLASDGGRLPERCSNYVNLYVNLSMYALISSQLSDCIAQDPLPNWLTEVSQPRVHHGMNAITPLYCSPRCWLCC